MDLHSLPTFAVALLSLLLALLGLSVGSFLNVVIARVPEGVSIVRPRSRCPRCGRGLSWYENIPVLSWLGLRGRCSGCRLPISVRYPLVELLTGGFYVAALLRFGWGYELVLGLVLISILIPLVFIDAEHWFLPFEITLPGIAAGILLSIPFGWERFEGALWGAIAGFLAFRALEYFGWLLFKKEALGGGDKYLLALLGAFLTWKPLLGIIFLASLQGAIFGLLKLAFTGRAGPTNNSVPGGEQRDDPEMLATMTWEFAGPRLPLWKRLVLLPINLLFQPIPDEAPAGEGAEAEVADWVPGATNLPFGPWLAIAGTEILLLGPFLQNLLPGALTMLVGGEFRG